MNGRRFVALCGLLVFTIGGVELPKAQAVDPPTKIDVPLRPLSVRSLAYSPDDKLLVAAGGSREQPGAVVAWDVETRKLLWQNRGTVGFSSVSFAPDGKSVAVTHNKPTALRLDSLTGRELGTVGPHPVTVRAVVHVPGTNLLATGSDGVIRLWDLKTGKVAKELKGHPAEVHSLVVSPNGRWLVSTGPDTTRIWDVNAGTELKDAIEPQRNGYNGIVFLAANRLLIIVGGGWIHKIVELPSGKEVLRFKNNGGSAGAAYSSTAGLAAFRWHDDSVVWLTDLTFREPTAAEKDQIQKLLKDFDDDSSEVRVAASTAMRKLGSVTEPALRAAMTNGPSPEVRMRARETRKVILDEPLRRLAGHTGAVGPMAFSPDGKVIATGADDGTVRLWNPQTGKELARLEASGPGENPRP